MANGDLWQLPDARQAIEVGRGVHNLRVLPIVPGSTWPAPPIEVVRAACTKLGSRYHGGAVHPEPDQAPLTHG
jgi:hypothetical protein